MPKAGPLGSYVLTRPLGPGGRVWEAELQGPAGFRKWVALRVLTEPVEFEVAQAAALSEDSGSVAVHGVERAGTVAFCTMERVQGGPVAGAGALPTRALVDVGLQVCESLSQRARLVEILPRDVLDAGGRVKLAPPWRRPSVTESELVRCVARVLQASAGADVGVALDRCITDAEAGRFRTLAQLQAALRTIESGGPGFAELPSVVPGATLPFAAVQRGNVQAVTAPVGREASCAEIVARLTTGRWVTVKGPPGVGKRHLVRWVGQARQEVGVAEVWWAPGPSAAAAVAQALGLAEPAVGAELAERGDVLLLLSALQRDQGPMLSSWLRMAPGLRLLVASTWPFGQPGEQRVELGPLAPEHARALVGERLGDGELAAADGLPGALCFFSATHPHASKPVARLLADSELGRGLRAMEAGLSAWERRALARISAHPGPLSLEQAERLLDLELSDAPWALDVLAALVDRSLVHTEPGAAAQFRMLAPIRAWARTLAQ